MIKHHIGHAVVDIEEEQEVNCQALFEQLEFRSKVLQSRKSKIINTKDDFERKGAILIATLKTKKKEMSRLIERKFETMIKEATDGFRDFQPWVADKVAAIDENFVLLNSIRESTDQETTSQDDIMSRLETFRDIEESILHNLSGARKYTYFEYNEGQVVGGKCK